MNTAVTSPALFSPELSISDALAASWLAEATLRLRREIAWQWYLRGDVTAANPDQLPPMIDALSESLDLTRFSTDKQHFFTTDITAKFLSEKIAGLRENRILINERNNIYSHSSDSHNNEPRNYGSWAAVCARLELDDCAQFVFALGLLARTDPASIAVIAACQNDAPKNLPTLALALRLLDGDRNLLSIDSSHPLFRLGLLQFHNENTIASWHEGYDVAPLIASVFVNDDNRLPAELRLVNNVQISGELPSTLVAAINLLNKPATETQFIPLLGDAGTEFSEWAAVISNKTGRVVVELAQPVIPPISRLTVLATWCWLYDADLLLPSLTVIADEHTHERINWPVIPLRWFAPIQDARALKQLPAYALKPVVVLPVTNFEMRVQRFEQVLGRHSETLKIEILEAARCFRLGMREIDAIGLAAKPIKVLRGEQLHSLCRAQVRLDLGSLAQPVTPRFTLNDLVLPPTQTVQLHEIINAMRALTRVHYRWGTARVWNEAGLSVLFCGPPGTGKTMAAEAIADELQLPMFRIDLSQVVNKYIGETEKNLKKVFDAAEESDCVIFFDEADALFGKRTSVKDAHDRFANTEISYLLERMERLKGIAILATNRRKDLDEAFLRRLRCLIEFPLPDERERERLWRYVFPGDVDVSKLDIEFLARNFPLAGGHIRSIAFNACLQAGTSDKPAVAMTHVLLAVKRELDKLNRPNSPESFGKYQYQVADLFEETTR
ncbi:MAG: hypothetical protein B0W54_01625 [Cellvibrio sp. 79]|nr:MAG: hypothetical protein B0W54_01625 [Cellvibrio sp. 79]